MASNSFAHSIYNKNLRCDFPAKSSPPRELKIPILSGGENEKRGWYLGIDTVLMLVSWVIFVLKFKHLISEVTMRTKIIPILTILLSIVYVKGETNISNLIFFDLTYDDTFSASSFNVKRTYLDFQSNLTKDMSLRITTDVGRTDEDGRAVVFLKHAFLNWKTNYGDLIIGVQPTNYFGPTTKTWGYRFIEKYPGDLWGFGATSDLGISIIRKIGGRLFVQGAVYNGVGYKKPEDDKYKRFSLLAAYGEKRLDKNPGWNIGGNFSFEPTDTSKKYTAMGFVGVAIKKIRIGGEYIAQADYNPNDQSYDQKLLTVFYGSLMIAPKTSLLIRAEMFAPSSNMIEDLEIYTIVGFNYSLNSHVYIAPTLHYTKYEDTDCDPTWFFKLNFQFKT